MLRPEKMYYTIILKIKSTTNSTNKLRLNVKTTKIKIKRNNSLNKSTYQLIHLSFVVSSVMQAVDDVCVALSRDVALAARWRCECWRLWWRRCVVAGVGSRVGLMNHWTVVEPVVVVVRSTAWRTDRYQAIEERSTWHWRWFDGP